MIQGFKIAANVEGDHAASAELPNFRNCIKGKMDIAFSPVSINDWNAAVCQDVRIETKASKLSLIFLRQNVPIV
jgi:hypothetical protein